MRKVTKITLDKDDIVAIIAEYFDAYEDDVKLKVQVDPYFKKATISAMVTTDEEE